MRRRTAGIGAIKQDKRKAELFKDKGTFNVKVHSVPSYKEHLYKERLVEHKSFKEQTLVNFE